MMMAFYLIIFGERLGDCDQNIFGMRRSPQSFICPIRGTEHYVNVVRRMQVDLTRGNLFRPIKWWNFRCPHHFDDVIVPT